MEDDLRTTPSFNQSSMVLEIKSEWASGILNCFRYTGLLSFKWILLENDFALPKSVLEVLRASLQ